MPCEEESKNLRPVAVGRNEQQIDEEPQLELCPATEAFATSFQGNLSSDTTSLKQNSKYNKLRAQEFVEEVTSRHQKSVMDHPLEIMELNNMEITQHEIARGPMPLTRGTNTVPGAPALARPGAIRMGNRTDSLESTMSSVVEDNAHNETLTIQAEIVDEDVLQAQIRKQIIDDAVEANLVVDNVQEKQNWLRRWTLLAALLLAAAALVLGLVFGISPSDGILDTTTDCDLSVEFLTVIDQCECFGVVVDIDPVSLAEVEDLSNIFNEANTTIETNFRADPELSCSAENLALLWVANETIHREQEGMLRLDTPRLIQRYSLATLHLSTLGKDWSENDMWMTLNDECNWFGVTCNNVGMVTALALSKQNLNGTVPRDIMALSLLETVMLDSNLLTGTLPDKWLLDLKSLEVFEVSSNRLEGNLLEVVNITSLTLEALSFLETNPNVTFEEILLEPRIIGFERNVFSLRFSNNSFSGPAPLGHLLLRTLEDYRIDHNDIAGSVGVDPFIADLIPLFPLFPTLPDTSILFRAFFRELEYFDTSHNQITGYLPEWLFLLDDLEYVDVSHNGFSGTIPTGIGAWTDIKYLDASYNHFQGTLPTELLQLAQLRHFDMRGNPLLTRMPPEMCFLQFLGDVHVDCGSDIAAECSCCNCR